MFRVVLPSAVALATVLSLSQSAQAVEVYFFKGAGDFSFVNENLHFSRGLNEMAETLNKEGIHAEVRRFGAVDDALRTIRKRKPESVAIIGHSMGALASMAMARSLKGENIRIAYMGLIDIPGPVGVAGENVEWVENYYSINPVYGVLTNARSHPKAKNIHVTGFIHNRMDNAPKVQNGMLSAIRKIQAEENPSAPEPASPEILMVNTGNSGSLSTGQQQVYVAPTPQYSNQTVSSSTQAMPANPAQAGTVGGYTPPGPVPANPVIDPVTTASVDQPDMIDDAWAMLRKAGNMVRQMGGNSRHKTDTGRYQSGK